RFLLRVIDPAVAASSLPHPLFREARLCFWLTFNCLALTATALFFVVFLFDLFKGIRAHSPCHG
ncbi:MAG TPA: hypothetical protein DDZ83_12190, partial [Nitrospinae bacterium]|nr:hypothetical protein [Nitrospinota bacterium]